MKLTKILATIVLIAIPATTLFAEVPQFKKPAKEIEQLVMASPLPVTHFNVGYTKALMSYMDCRYLPLEDLAGNEVRIGGVRMDPKTFSETRESWGDRLELLDVASGTVKKVVGLPEKGQVKHIHWSQSGRTVAFTVTIPNQGTWIYTIDATQAEPSAKRFCERRVNAIYGNPFAFIDDNTILFKGVPENIGEMPKKGLSFWPIVQENHESKKSIRTYQDMLSSPYDEDLFDYCCNSELLIAGAEGIKTVGEKGIYRSYELSPDCNYILVTTEHKPYSYVEGHRTFPSYQYIIDRDGKLVKVIKDGRKKEDAEKDNDKSKAPKPSGFGWRPDQPATLYWTEAAGGHGGWPGRPHDDDADNKDKDAKDKPEKTFTDTLYQCNAPFDFESSKTVVLAPEYKIGQIVWCDDNIAFFYESSGKQKFRRLSSFVPCDTLKERKVIYTQSTEVDTLGNFPVYGRPYTVANKYGKKVAWTDAKHKSMLLTGNNRPDSEKDHMYFIDKVGINDGKIVNLWTGQAPYMEKIIGITGFDNLKFISTRENFSTVPDFWETTLKGKKINRRQLTHIENPVPQLTELITREYVTYTRKDGLICSANLYLPAGYKKEEGKRLPVLMWTYPYDYKCKAQCENEKTDRYNFIKPSYTAALIWATQGYAVLENFTMAIIAADKDSLANDRFQEQLVMSAESAVDFIVDTLGIGDRERIGVGGHSYGAYMTVNLLAHTRLFKAGIARSGAYNRSLTPFGFQSENRTYWKAPALYADMSPFNYADKIKDALLLIHGQMDNNQGTFPDQSARLYQALVYFGAPVRYLQMPYESHSYLGRETVLDMLYETGAWLDKYLKYPEPEKTSENK